MRAEQRAIPATLATSTAAPAMSSTGPRPARSFHDFGDPTA
jgi:hypothetical protein